MGNGEESRDMRFEICGVCVYPSNLRHLRAYNLISTSFNNKTTSVERIIAGKRTSLPH